MEASTTTSRIFKIDRTAFARHYTIESTSDKRQFYADISSLTPNKPDLTMHAGPDNTGAIVAVCHIIKFTGDYKLGFGDPSRPGDMQWDDITKESGLKASVFRWETTVPTTESTQPTRKVLWWKRTRSVGVGGSSPSAWSIRNWKLVDEASGEVLAAFTSDWSPTKCGNLEIRVNLGDEFDVMVLTACLGLYEKARRRASRSNMGGGAH